MAVAERPQISMAEHVVEDAALEAALEDRQRLKEAARDAGKAYREADEKARAALAAHPLGDRSLRIGRFVVSESTVAPREVTFETGATTRLNIKAVQEP
jgi:hypothetical protein